MSDRLGPAVDAELEKFREQWRQEVNGRNKKPARLEAKGSTTSKHSDVVPSCKPVATEFSPLHSIAHGWEAIDYSEEIEPRAYHDLPDREEELKLGDDGSKRGKSREPCSALEHYEHAVEKEIQGQLGDSVRHYRTAFKLDDGVHETYKKKHFPPSAFVRSSPGDHDPSNVAVTVAGTDHHSLHGSNGGSFPSSLRQMIEDFSICHIEPASPPTDAPTLDLCPMAKLPDEILVQVMAHLALIDVASFVRLARVSKRFAYLVLTEESTWKQVATGEEFGFAAMHYNFACSIEGFRFKPSASPPVDDDAYYHQMNETKRPLDLCGDHTTSLLITEHLLHSLYHSSWRSMFRSRPRIRFNGCYISTVNYSRPGASSTNTLTWGAPVHVVTYFRYLRFFRDGTAISLLTTSEPVDVVHHLTKENLHDHHINNLPSSVMKDALRGRWRLSGPLSSVIEPAIGEPETEGDLHVETEGVVAKYTYKLLLALSHAGKGARNNKLAWKGFWSYNKLTDDWGEFGLKNDRAFHWSRVKSYGTGLEGRCGR